MWVIKHFGEAGPSPKTLTRVPIGPLFGFIFFCVSPRQPAANPTRAYKPSVLNYVDFSLRYHVTFTAVYRIHIARKIRHHTRARHIISLFRSTSKEVSTNFHWSKFTSVETSIEIGGIIFISMEISMEVDGSRFTSIEVSGTFHGNTCKVPLSVGVEASIAYISWSFHQYIPWKLPWASIYLYILPRTSASIKTSSCSTRLTLTLTLSWNYSHRSWSPNFNAFWWWK